MKTSLLCLMMVWGYWAICASGLPLTGGQVRIFFDSENAVISQIEVKNSAGVFVPMAGRAVPEITTVVPDSPKENLRIGKLLNADPAAQRFVYSIIDHPGWSATYAFTTEADILRWQVTVKNPTDVCVGLEVNLCFGDLYVGSRREFNNMSLTPNGYSELTYRADYIGEFPMTSILDDGNDVGLTLNATFGVMRPLFSIQYNKNLPEHSLIWRNQYIGSGDGIEARVSVDFFGHSGDWRPGLGQIYRYYCIGN